MSVLRGPNPSVNRYLEDKAMDHIDHALGRPFDPMQESFRNYFAIGATTDLARSFEQSPNWKMSRVSDDMAYYHVTDAGRAALASHLKHIRSPYRRFVIEFGGFTSTVISISRAKARYSKWLEISDPCPELSFVDFCCRAKVRVAA